MKTANKKFMLSKLGLILLFSYAGSPLHAGDMGPMEPVEELWNGFRFGLYAGSGSGGGSQTLDEDISLVFTAGYTGHAESQPSVRGSLADFFIGYDYHPHPDARFVFGGQLEVTLNDIVVNGFGEEFIVSNNPNSESYQRTITLQDKLRSSFNLIARGGYLPCSNLLVYALGGLVEGHFILPDTPNSALFSFNQSNSTPLSGGPFNVHVTKKDLWTSGGTVGAGAEFKITEHLSFLAEYRYMAFNYNRNDQNTLNFTSNGTTFPGAYNTDIQSHIHFNLGQIGFAYRV